MKEYVKEYISFLSVEKRHSPHTVSAYRRDIAKFIDFFSDSSVTSMTTSDIRIFLIKLQEEGLSSTSQARCLSSLKSFFKFLISEKYIKESPVEILETPRRWRRLPKLMSIAEVDALMDSPDKNTHHGIRDRAMLEVLYATGLRVSELVSLKKSDLNLEVGYLRSFGKGSKERIVPMGEAAQVAVKDYLLRSRPVFLKNGNVAEIFITQQGAGMTRQGFWKILKRYVLQANKIGRAHV